jgi:hypothetical protein
VLVACVAAVPGSPLQPALVPEAGPSGPFAWLTGVLGVDRLEGSSLVAASFAATAVATGAFLWVLRVAWDGRLRLRLVVVLAIAAQVAVLWLPLLVSRDVYSYIAYGRLQSVRELNPYVAVPSDLLWDGIVGLVGPKWLETPAVYGPAFTRLTAVITETAEGKASSVAAFRAIAAAAAIATIATIAATARRWAPDRAAFAVAAFGMGPVVWLSSVASGHNDLLVALAIAVALWLLLAERTVLAVLALTLGMLVKVTAGLPLLLLVVWAVARRPSGERLRAAAVHLLAVAVPVLVFATPYWQTEDPSLGLVELSGHEGWLAPSRLLRRGLDAVSGGTLGAGARVVFAVVLLVAIGVLLVWLLRRVSRSVAAPAVLDAGASWGWALVLLMLLGPVLLPWYVTWALPLVWLVPKVPRLVTVATAALLGVSQWVAEPSVFADAYGVNITVGRYLLAPVALGLVGWLLVDLRRRARALDPIADPAIGSATRLEPPAR